MSTALNERHDAFNFADIVASNIRALAARRNMNQSQIARALGINQGAINQRWNGRRQWQLEDIARVADILGTTPWKLCEPSEYDESRPVRTASVSKLPRLDSNQQPFD